MNAPTLRATAIQKYNTDDKEKWMKSIENAYSQIGLEKVRINDQSNIIKWQLRSSSKGKEMLKIQLEILKKQYELTEKLINELKSKKLSLSDIQANQIREESKPDKSKCMKDQSKPKISRKRTYKQAKSYLFRKYKIENGKEDIRGIHSSEKTRQNRSFKALIYNILYKQEKIDFKQLFRAFNILL